MLGRIFYRALPRRQWAALRGSEEQVAGGVQAEPGRVLGRSEPDNLGQLNVRDSTVSQGTALSRDLEENDSK